mmetsp:Transcript_25031/g.80881  ORF Transcript_25031/g.80881 Transcript_25031/m.80881 type:complete len:91 (-) Transcript_25031:191-463(-)
MSHPHQSFNHGALLEGELSACVTKINPSPRLLDGKRRYQKLLDDLACDRSPGNQATAFSKYPRLLHAECHRYTNPSISSFSRSARTFEQP